jgi:hypothetical protein
MMRREFLLFIKGRAMAKQSPLEKVQALLKRRPMRTAAILAALGISQPTFSRAWQNIREGVTLGAGRARTYALRRQVEGVSAPIPVFRVDEEGHVESIGVLEPLQDIFYALTTPGHNDFRLFEGMPYFLRDLRPQGFLGRLEPGKHRDLDLPADILRWTDAQVMKFISRRSENAPGDLIAGNESYARYLLDIGTVNETAVRNAERVALYPNMARHAMQGEQAGSSAGGEQPKFTAIIAHDEDGGTVDHVIVKFSPHVDTANGRRWGDLLICEHLALEVLMANQVAAARTAIVEADGRIFLEVIRFDRVGLLGRRPMATFSALDGDLGMLDQGWTDVAHELAQRGDLSAADVKVIEILDLFGAMIGNTDKHHGNIAVAWSMDSKYTLLPAYDMLPMLYRPNTHGEIVARKWRPDLGAGLALRHFSECHRMAEQFWLRVLEDDRISQEFKLGPATTHLHNLRKLQLSSPAP